jgi:hypothetical protein
LPSFTIPVNTAPPVLPEGQGPVNWTFPKSSRTLPEKLPSLFEI